MQCQNNLKQIGLGLHGFHDTYKHLPAGTLPADDLPRDKRLSWLVTIMPFVESNRIYEQIQQKLAWDAAENQAAVSAPMPIYRCPALAAMPNRTGYVGVAGIDPGAVLLAADDPRAGIFGDDRRVRLADLTRGTDQTLAVLETTADVGPWAAGGFATVRGLDPAAPAYVSEDGPFGVKHKSDTLFHTNPVVMNAAFADASVRAVPESVAPAVLRALVPITGGERVPMDF